MSIWHKLLLLVLIPLIFEILFVLVLANLLQYAEKTSEQYEHSRDVLTTYMFAETAIVHTMTTLVTGGSASHSRFDSIDPAIAQVRYATTLLNKSADLQPELKEVMAGAPELFESAIRAVENGRKDFMAGTPNEENLATMRKAGLPLILDFDQFSKNLMRVENHINAVAPKELARAGEYVFWLLVLGTLSSIGLSLGAAVYFFNNILKRLRIVEENARLLAMRAPLIATALGDDEIARLDAALHKANQVLENSRRKELAILDVATDVICSADRRFKITASGAASFHSWGYGADDLLGRSILSLQTSDCEPVFREALEEIARHGQDSQFESQLVTRGGLTKDYLWKVNWSRENQTYFCVAHDISSRRAAERMKQRFIAIVSHDLSTPLSSISATLAVLLSSANSLSESARNILAKAEVSLQRLMDLIRDLLDLEKLEAGKLTLDISAVSAQDICTAACDSVEFLARSLEVKLVRSHRDVLLRGDERRLIRVLINLISNAIKFSPRHGTVTIHIEGHADHTEISVIDQGPGIPAGDRELIFEKFRQSSTQSAVKGTGLGLAISKLIVTGHGGTIGVDSSDGKGSRFYIRIPNFEMENEPE